VVCTKRRIIVTARAASPSIWGKGFHPFRERRCALRFKASAVTMWSLLYQGVDVRWDSRRASPSRQHTSVSLCLDGPTEKYGCITPRTKSARPRNSRKSWQHFEHLRTAMARTGRHEEEAPHKVGVGVKRPRVQRRIIRCASSWLLPTAARR
jgi:hypothetical protein